MTDEDWQPSASLAMLQRRAALLAAIRAFFAARAVLEVDVPVLSVAAGVDPNIESLTVSSPLAAHEHYWLMTSPELYMKRLLAAGSGAIYYLGRAFRAGDLGSRHQPEFCMLEWYRPGWTLATLREEVAALLQLFVDSPVRHTSYGRLFDEHVGLDPHSASLDALREAARQHIDVAFDSEDRAVWLDLLFSHRVEPQLQGVVIVEGFPAAQAALAQTTCDESGNPVAARFELYVDGIEIANAYQEELDADVLRARFERDLQQRAARGQVQPPVDQRFLAAMRAGMPACAGVALGVDRLLMVASGRQQIREVLPFAL